LSDGGIGLSARADFLGAVVFFYAGTRSGDFEADGGDFGELDFFPGFVSGGGLFLSRCLASGGGEDALEDSDRGFLVAGLEGGSISVDCDCRCCGFWGFCFLGFALRGSTGAAGGRGGACCVGGCAGGA